MKKFLALLAILACVLTLSFGLVACNDNPQNEPTVEYSVSLMCMDSSLIPNLKVQLVSAFDENDKTEAVAFTNGMATFNVKADSYKAVLTGLDDNHKATVDPAVLTASVRDCTITVSEKTADDQHEGEPYEVYVKYPDNTPAVGVTVQLCIATQCFPPIQTDSQGKAEFTLDSANYDVHITAGIREGYTFDDNKYKLTTTDRIVTVVLDELVTYKVIVNYADGGDGTPAENIDVLIALEDNTRVDTLKTNAQGVATMQAKEADYVVSLINLPSSYECTPSNRLQFPNKTGTDETVPTIVFTISRKGGDITNRILLVEGDNNLTVSDAKSLWYEFDYKEKPGQYTISSSGSVDTEVYYYAGSVAYINPNPQGFDTSSGEGNNFSYTFGIELDCVGALYVFRIDIKGDSPVGTAYTVNIHFDKEIASLGDLPTTNPVATQMTTQSAPPAGTLTNVDMKKDTVVYNEEDHLYHLNSKTGAVIYVLLANDSVFASGFWSESFEYSMRPPKDMYDDKVENHFIVYTPTERQDYNNFLKQYIACANSDGVHVLTEEMKDFLQAYYTQTKDPTTLSTPNDFTFACAYYAE